MNIKAFSLFSGSRCNSFYIDTGSTRVLIDAGASAGATEKALSLIGSSLEALDAIFITHAHTDHIKGLPLLCRKTGASIHMPKGVERALSFPPGTEDRVFLHDTYDSGEAGGIRFSSFATPHDCDVSVGYVFRVNSGGTEYRLGYLTDTGHIDSGAAAALRGADACVIESNHDIMMLKNGKYPPELKKRILSPFGHLSNRDASAFIGELAAQGTRSFMLAHISAENNTPELALRTASLALSDFGNVFLCAASQCSPVELVIPEKSAVSQKRAAL